MAFEHGDLPLRAHIPQAHGIVPRACKEEQEGGGMVTRTNVAMLTTIITTIITFAVAITIVVNITTTIARHADRPT